MPDMRKLKICNIGWAYSPHVNRVAKWFAEKGHDVSILSDQPFEVEGVKVYNLYERDKDKTRWQRYRNIEFNISWKWLRRLEGLVHVKKIIKNISPDIVHSHSLWHPGYYGGYLNFHPYVVSVFNGDVLWTRNNVGLFEKCRTGMAFKKADLVLGESKTLIEAAIARGADPQKSHIMKIGVDLKVFNIKNDKIKLREKLKLPADANIILSPRSISDFYNLKSLIRAIPKVIEKVPSSLFVFIGFGVSNEYLNELKRDAERLRIKNNVLFVGKVDYSAVAEYHKASDVFVSVSPKDSGPIALQEAMACGNVPVISNLPSVRELVTDKINGFLVNPSDEKQIADAVITLLLNDTLRAEIAERNWKIAQDKCDQEKEMQKMEGLYYKLLEENKR